MRDGKIIVSFEVDSDAGITELMEKDLLDITAKKHRSKRSLTANSYMWVLIGQIAEKTEEPRTEIYRQAIQEAGVMKPLVVREEIAKEVQSTLTDVKPTGTGDFALLGATRNGWTELYLYIGSSKYNTKEMARLIDYIVDECRPLGIDTMTKDEIERLKQEWRNQ